MSNIKFQVCGLPAKYYVPLLIIVLLASYMGTLSTTVVGAIPYLMAVGGLFFWLGNTIPILNSYLGGACLLPLFGTSFMNFLGLIPDGTVAAVTNLMRTAGYQDFYIAAILVGSVLCMDRKILLNATARYMPAILISQVFAIGFCLLGGIMTGQGISTALFDIGAPCMSGGSAGAITTLPATYSQLSGLDLTYMAGPYLCYASISNVLAVLFAAIGNKVFDKIPGWSGHGAILVARAGQSSEEVEVEKKGSNRPGTTADFAKVGAGILIACTIYEMGMLINHFIPGLAGLAWAIIIAIVIKCTGILPEDICDTTTYWMNFMLKNGLPMLIAGIGIVSLDITTLSSYFSIGAFIVIILAVVGAFVGAMIGGKLAGLYPYETGVTAGLCCCNIGGSGDIAVLTAANRMNLLAFASISTRIGGALMVIWISLLYPLFSHIYPTL